MEGTTLEELSENFSMKLDRIGMMLKLRNACEDDASTQQLKVLETELNRQVNNVITVKKTLLAEIEHLETLKQFNQGLKEWKEKLLYMSSNIPALPKKNNPSVQTNQQREKSQYNAAKQDGGQSVGSQGCQQPIAKQEQSQGASKQSGNTYCPEIDWLTTDEFENIPKYLKGRLSYDQLNKFIEGMNKAYSAKYKLLKLKKSSLNDAKRKKYETFKLQETKDTAGCYFIVDDDLKEFGCLNVDKVTRSILTILRHCGRCREVRGGKLTRYCYIDSY